MSKLQDIYESLDTFGFVDSRDTNEIVFHNNLSMITKDIINRINDLSSGYTTSDMVGNMIEIFNHMYHDGNGDNSVVCLVGDITDITEFIRHVVSDVITFGNIQVLYNDKKHTDEILRVRDNKCDMGNKVIFIIGNSTEELPVDFFDNIPILTF